MVNPGHVRGCRVALALSAVLLLSSAGRAASDDAAIAARIDRILEKTPLIDGHNDLPWELRERSKDGHEPPDLRVNHAKVAPPEGMARLMTDVPRLRAGHVGGQFWSVWIPVTIQGPAAVQTTLEQIDVVKQMAAAYPDAFEMAYSAADIRRIHAAGRVASLIGVEGGHQIDDSLAVLRQMYAAGARYMTLTHATNTAWADSATDEPVHHGLTPFGREVVREMNRLGMLVDLSHVSAQTMKDALETTTAPVIFSHSSARAVDDHPRHVPDDVLRTVAENGGIVMANFAPDYVSRERLEWSADRSAEQARYYSPPFGGLYIGRPGRAKAALGEWESAHPKPAVTLSQVADHIQHIRDVAGVDHLGLGSDFDGISDTPVGLEGVDRFPALLAELMRRGWSDADIAKLAGQNLLRVFSQAETVAARLRRERPVGSTATLAGMDAASDPGQ